MSAAPLRQPRAGLLLSFFLFLFFFPFLSNRRGCLCGYRSEIGLTGLMLSARRMAESLDALAYRGIGDADTSMGVGDGEHDLKELLGRRRLVNSTVLENVVTAAHYDRLKVFGSTAGEIVDTLEKDATRVYEGLISQVDSLAQTIRQKPVLYIKCGCPAAGKSRMPPLETDGHLILNPDTFCESMQSYQHLKTHTEAGDDFTDSSSNGFLLFTLVMKFASNALGAYKSDNALSKQSETFESTTNKDLGPSLLQYAFERRVSFVYDAANDEIDKYVLNTFIRRAYAYGYNVRLHVLIALPATILRNRTRRITEEARGIPVFRILKSMQSLYGVKASSLPDLVETPYTKEEAMRHIESAWSKMLNSSWTEKTFYAVAQENVDASTSLKLLKNASRDEKISELFKGDDIHLQMYFNDGTTIHREGHPLRGGLENSDGV